jgi:hypothetical protein
MYNYEDYTITNTTIAFKCYLTIKTLSVSAASSEAIP